MGAWLKGVEHGVVPTRSNFEDKTSIAKAKSHGCSIQISVVCLNKTTIRVCIIFDGERVKYGQRISGKRELENRAIAILPAKEGDAIKISVSSQHQRAFWL